ncbi:hypothetical protein OKW43_000915 [Paraburkholderia sp. WC7.3g]
MEITLDELRTFAAVVDTGSITAAAQQLDLTVSAASRTLGLPRGKASQDQLSFRRLLRIGNTPRSDADLIRCALPLALSTLLLITMRTMRRSVIALNLQVGGRCVVSRIPPSTRWGPRGAPVATG